MEKYVEYWEYWTFRIVIEIGGVDRITLKGMQDLHAAVLEQVIRKQLESISLMQCTAARVQDNFSLD